MKASPAQTNFTGGEISPLLTGRVDVSKYKNGASKLRNVMVRPQGGSWRRAGTRTIQQCKLGPSKRSRLFSFEFSDEQTYILEFGDQYLHFYKNGEPLFETTNQEGEAFTLADNGGWMQLVFADADMPGWGDLNAFFGDPNIGDITISNYLGQCMITTTVPHTLQTGMTVKFFSTEVAGLNGPQVVTRFSTYQFLTGVPYAVPGAGATCFIGFSRLPGDKVYISGAMDYPELSEKFFVVKSVDAYNLITLANVPFTNYAGAPAGEELHCVPIELYTPYTEAELEEIRICQSADVLYIVHPNHPPMKLMRLDTDGDRGDWLLVEVPFTDGPYLPLNDLSPTRNPDSQYGSRFYDVNLEITAYTHTASVKVMGAVNFVAGDVNKYLEYRVGNQYRLGQLTAQAGATGTINVIDNILTYLDESVKLKLKKDRPEYIPGSGQSSASTPTYNQNKINGTPGNTSAQRIDSRNGVFDTVTVAGTLTSQFSNTFSTADIGKYIRYEVDSNPPVAHWALIDGVPKSVGTTAHHAAAVTKVANYDTGKFIITSETRTCTIKSYKLGVLYSIFASTDTGRLIRLGWGGRWVWGRLTYVSGSECTVTLYDDLPRSVQNALVIAGNQDPATPNSGITYDWRLGAWSATTGYPSVVTFHEQRLCFANTSTESQTFWGSRSGDYENMSPTEPDSTVLDDSAINITLVSGKVSPILWMKSGTVLLVGGLTQEWQIRAASSINEPITPSNIQSLPQTDFGSLRSFFPQTIGASTYFADRHGKKIREMSYNFELDRHVSIDSSIIAEHLFREGQRAAYSEFQRNPFNVLWCVLNDGTLATLVSEKDHEISAWQLQSLGGTAVVESIAIESNASVDRVYMVVKRTINGVTNRFVEVIDQDFFGVEGSNETTMPFLDSHFMIETWSAVTELNGLDKFNGETLYVIADGVYLGAKTVASGKVTVTSGTEFVIGYNFTSLIGILPIEAGAYYGSAQVKTKRVNRVGLRVMKTTSLKVGSSENGSYDSKNLPSSFYTGDLKLDLKQNHNFTGEFFIKQDVPEPLNVLLVSPELLTNEEV